MRVGSFAFAAYCGLTLAAPTITKRASVDDCPGYKATNVEDTGSGLKVDLTLAGARCDSYSEDLQDLVLEVEYQTEDRLHVHIYDAGLNQYQVQDGVFPRPENKKTSPSDSLLEFKLNENPFSFQVIRKGNNSEILFDTTGHKLVFESQYLGLRTNLPDNPNIYGLGESSDPFRLPTQGYHRTLWNSESPYLPFNSNLYGSHPVYFDHRGASGTHGVFLLNADGMDVNISKGDDGKQYLEYNVIGGTFDFYFLAGKQPSDVSRQYAEVAGYSPMYPYWTFGFQQCKYGYWDVNMVAEVVGNYSKAGIPLEVMWTDIDYMDRRRDFTTDPENFPHHKMVELVDTLHSRNQKYILILDPSIYAKDRSYGPYQRGDSAGIFIKKTGGSNGEDYLGVQWPGIVAWPDWFHPDTQDWWTNEIIGLFNSSGGIDIDGLWVDMNEASNFCHNYNCNLEEAAVGNPPALTHTPRPNTGRPIEGFPKDFQPGSTTPSVKARYASPVKHRNTLPAAARGMAAIASPQVNSRELGAKKGMPRRDLLTPKYKIQNHVGELSNSTLRTDQANYDGTMQYDTHNLYGHMMGWKTHEAMLKRRPTKRPFVMTRSTFAGTGRKINHWFGDNESSWEHYRLTIRQMLTFVSMHQMPMVGSDVCGFNSPAEERMCARWALLGAFQPFYRNHAEISTPQQEFYQWNLTRIAGKKAIDARYKLMDYAYTGLYRQTTKGEPWIKPLFFEYPEDANTFNIQTQWFYGDSLLISPVIDDYSDTVTFYLPKGNWYDYWTGNKVPELGGANITRSNVSFTDIPVFIKGGSIIPTRLNSANTTTELRKQPFNFLIAPDENGEATGRLYIDEGELIDQPDITELELTWKDGKLSSTGTRDYNPSNGESVEFKQITVLGQDGGSYSDPNTKYDAKTKVSRKTGQWKLNEDFQVSL
ncbi:alpha-glucosidase precursor [Lophiotrema nucula]|uniref:alpha-glucosidase n=1 Tax=Lophiotrema nucula TaxID=690887 RepID=A0A6A5ZB31_9PLEO|nr:alpha-glucosidase precursor [Lophiotrema nucula]